MEKAVLKVKGMTCMGCVASVRRVLQAVEGVREVEVSLEREQATLEYDASLASPERFRAAVEDAGYEVA